MDQPGSSVVKCFSEVRTVVFGVSFVIPRQQELEKEGRHNKQNKWDDVAKNNRGKTRC